MTRTELLQNAKPILFNTEMARAILEGRKTEARRVIKPQPELTEAYCLNRFTWRYKHTSCALMDECDVKSTLGIVSPYQPGDILWVRETWDFLPSTECGCFCLGPCDKEFHGEFGCFTYRASTPNFTSKWRPSIHMPKEAARIWLMVKKVRVERLQEISVEDAVAEGCITPKQALYVNHKGYFSDLWNSTIKPADLPLYGWETNPWVWVIEFVRVEVR